MNQTLSSAETWRRVLREHQVRGGSVAAFCRLARVPQASFYFWRRKLRGERRLVGVRRRRARAGSLVEVKVPAESLINPGGHRRSRTEANRTNRLLPGIELRLPGRWRVVVRPGFDRRTLLDSLVALEAAAFEGGVGRALIGGRAPREVSA